MPIFITMCELSKPGVNDQLTHVVVKTLILKSHLHQYGIHQMKILDTIRLLWLISIEYDL